jgi:hypothetical protein
MTYIDIVNNVLKRLRENEVTSLSGSSYASLIGLLVNDAKREIEDSWSWSALRQTLSVVTQANTFAYALTGSQNRITVLDVINDTEDFFMQYKTAHEMNDLFLNSTPETSPPRYYSFNGVNTNGDTQVDVYPIPDKAYDLRFNVVLRTADLQASSDKLLIPAQPVIQLAYAKAVEERGENGGITMSSAYTTAARVINDAISLDASKHPEETIWTTV